MENYKAKKQELSLKDNELRLSTQLKTLQSQMEEEKRETDTILKVKEHLH